MINSRIDGEFTGTEDEVVYKLENGQIWQQVGYKYRYMYKYRPEVSITGSSGNAVMIVDGFSDPIKVRRQN
jgi:hypothetical protein